MGSVEKSQEELDNEQNERVKRYMDEFFDQYVDLYMLRVQEFWGKLQNYYETKNGGNNKRGKQTLEGRFLRELSVSDPGNCTWDEVTWKNAVGNLTEGASTTGVEGNGAFADVGQGSGAKETLQDISESCVNDLLVAAKESCDGFKRIEKIIERLRNLGAGNKTPYTLTLKLLMVCFPDKFSTFFNGADCNEAGFKGADKYKFQAMNDILGIDVRSSLRDKRKYGQQDALDQWLGGQSGRCFACRIEKYNLGSCSTFNFEKPAEGHKHCMGEVRYKEYFVRQMLTEFVSWLGYEIESKSEFGEEIEKKCALVEAEHNIVLHGAPGTGKTYMAREIAAEIIGCSMEELGGNDQFGFVQFHPSYDYTDFVEGLRPTAGGGKEGGIGFEREDGAFKKFCKRARGDSKEKYVFVIDEINRGDISKVFGELFFSIDSGYRGTDGSVSTQYSNMTGVASDKFYVPENVYVISTMNDVDRSVDSFDYAMRRRFKFIEVKPKDTQEFILKGPRANYARTVMNELNKKIGASIGSQYELGASYFKDYASGREAAFDLWDYSLEPLLREYIEEAGMVADVEIGGYRDIFSEWVLNYTGKNCKMGTKRGQLAWNWLEGINGEIDKLGGADPAVRNKAKIDARFFIDYIERGFGFEEEDYKFIRKEIEGHINAAAAGLKVEAVPKLDKAIKKICQKEDSTNQASYWKSKDGVR